uniref:Secreted protein n=1 Tax=Setaria viridis TaxID=4556 RepID=A0A4U6TN17_SETVI|nr:hypothetical protein SEVIR_8G001625v2 [Setaria viridis]
MVLGEVAMLNCSNLLLLFSGVQPPVCEVFSWCRVSAKPQVSCCLSHCERRDDLEWIHSFLLNIYAGDADSNSWVASMVA